MKYFAILLLTLCGPLSVSAQNRVDIAAVGSGGFMSGDDQKTSSGPGIGSSFGFPCLGRHRFQLDYFFTNIGGELRAPGLHVRDADNRNQFLTASSALQARTGPGLFTAVSIPQRDIRTAHLSYTDFQWRRTRAWRSCLEAGRP